MCTQKAPSSVLSKVTLCFFITLLKLKMIVIALGWHHTLPNPDKCPFMFVVNSPPFAITVMLSLTSLVFNSGPLSPNELVVDWLSNKIHNNSFVP